MRSCTLFLILLVGCACLLAGCGGPGPTPFTYSDYSSLPSQVQSGERLTITWRASPDARTPADRPPINMVLAVELVSEANYDQSVCGHYLASRVLDRVTISNQQSAPLIRTVQLPQVPPGWYELVRSVKVATTTWCFGNRLFLP